MLNLRVRRLVALCGTVVATLLITIAVLVQLGRTLAPHVAENRQALADYLSQQLDATVEIGHIDAEWEGLRPQLRLQQFVITNSAGETAFSLQQAVAQLDILQSLFNRSVRLWQLEINQARGHFLQSADGRWGLKGLALPQPSATRRFDPLEVLLLGRFIRFDDVQFQFDFAHGRQQQLSFTEMLLQNQEDFHRLTGDLDLPSQRDAVTLVFEGEGDPRERHFSGNGYLKLSDYPLSQAAAFVSETLEAHAGVHDGQLSGELWLQLLPDQPLALEGQLSLQRPLTVNDELPQKFTTQLVGQWQPGQQWTLRLQDAQAVWQKKTWPSMNLLVSANSQDHRLHLQLPRLDVRWLSHLEVMPQVPDKVKRIIRELGIKGEMQNVSVMLPMDDPKAFQLQSRFQGVSVNPWKGSPGVQELSGFVQASLYQGEVQIDTATPFRLHFPKLYNQPFEFVTGQGMVYWEVAPESNQVRVSSSPLTMSGPLGNASGYFYLDAPIKRNSRPLELMLQIGLRDGLALDHRKLVPEVVPDSLSGWLDQAIAGGRVPSGGFLLHGYFGPEASRTRSIQAALNVADAELQFDPHWPALAKVSGHLLVDDSEVVGWLDQGKLGQGQLKATYLQVSSNPQGEGLLLAINGGLQGDAQTGLDLLTQTPLRDAIGAGLDHWQMRGQLEAEIQLRIPLLAGQPGSRQQVAVSLQDTDLHMQDIRLPIDGIQGQLLYSDDRGLQADQLTARLWRQPLTASIASEPGGAGGNSTEVKFNGSLDMAALASWSRRPEVLFVEGTVPVVGSVTVASGDVPVRLRAHSTLKGASIDLPEPYGKTVQQERRLQVDIPLSRNAVNYLLQYDQLVSVDLNAAVDQPLAGAIALGQSARRRQQPGIWLEGEAGQLDVTQWQPVLERYMDYSRRLSGAEVMGVAAESGLQSVSAQLNLDLMVRRLVWGDIELQRVQVGGGQHQQGWRIDLNDELIKGRLQISDGQKPLDIDLDYVHWPALESSGEAGVEAQLAEFDPSSIVPLDVSIKDLRIGQRDYGRWAFLVQPTSTGLTISDIQGRIDGIDIQATDRYPVPEDGGQTPGEGATIVWNKVPPLVEGDTALQTTRFHGRLASTNLADISDKWQLPRLLDSRKIVIDSDLRWEGSPFMFAMQELHGKLALDVRNGRFYRSTGQASDAFLRLVGLFNFDSWIRRLQLDFSDVFQGGTPFERVEGELKFDRGLIYLIDPIKVTNTSSVLQMGGSINLQQETLDTSLVATLPVGGNATLIAAFAGGLPAAAGVYAISKIFKKQVERMASVSYRIRGPWSDPDIKFDRLFDNKAAKEASKGN